MEQNEKHYAPQPIRDYDAEIVGIIRSGLEPEQIRDALENYHESDIAEAVSTLTSEERRWLYNILEPELISDVFSYLDDVEDFVEELSNEQVADIIQDMDADDAVDVLDELDTEKRQQIIDLLDKETAEDIELLNSYPDDQIGSRMTTNFVTIPRTLTIKQAMKSVVEQASENDNISTIYVLNEHGEYYGAITLRDLVVARSGDTLSDFVSTAYPHLYATESVDDCLEKLKDYSEDSIPLLNHKNQVIGVITGSELVDTISEEIEEDYAKFAGLTEQEDLDEGLGQSIKKRAPWLIALMFLGLLVSTLIGTFSTVITLLPILVCFQSLILGMCGNIGTQSLAVTLRVISTEDLDFKTKLKLIFKELRIGIVNGLLIGGLTALICSAYIYFVIGSGYGVTTYVQSLQISACIGGALLISMAVASLAGTLVPMVFKKIKIDPAVASGPLLTTINDMLGASLYYGLAYVFLILILG